MMTEHKRNPVFVDQEGINCFTLKRHKSELSVSTRDKKEKMGERVAALQQLVSPYGKTDTASVLLEAMEYIRFLHDQVKVLSSPYLQCAPSINMKDALSSRGLCLAPVSRTLGMARSNGADLWAPVKDCDHPKF